MYSREGHSALGGRFSEYAGLIECKTAIIRLTCCAEIMICEKSLSTGYQDARENEGKSDKASKKEMTHQ